MEKNSSKKHYIILILILLMATIFIFFLMINMKENKKAKPLTTTTNKINTTTKNPLDEPVITTNFRASLKTILEDIILTGDYEESFKFSGSKFSFNCTNYDTQTLKCVEGSALMDVGTALIPLYTYKNEVDNYYNRPDDYYIIITDDVIILSYIPDKNEEGISKIYSRDGDFKVDVPSLLMHYYIDNKKVDGMYPSITDNVYYYYTCANKKVAVAGYDLKTLKEKGIEEIIDGATCK